MNWDWPEFPRDRHSRRVESDNERIEDLDHADDPFEEYVTCREYVILAAAVILIYAVVVLAVIVAVT